MSRQLTNSAIRKQLRRLTHIVSVLKRGDVSAQEILHDLEANSRVGGREIICSARTLRRDIAVLREDYHCPIMYRASEHVYYLENHEWSFQALLPSAVSNDEALALVLGGKFAQDILPPTISRGVERAVDEILSHHEGEAFLSEQRIKSLKILVNAGPVLTEVFHKVFDAWRTCHCLTIDYCDANEKHVQHLIEPQSLVFYDMQWGLKAFCPKETKWRTFLLSRIENAYAMDQKFKPNDRYIRSITADNYFQFPEISGITIRLSKAGNRYAQAHPLHTEQKINADGQGNYILQVPKVSTEKAVPWILSHAHPGDAIPLEPQELVTAFKNALRAILEQCP